MEKLYTTKNLETIAEGDESFVKLMLDTFLSSCREAIEVMNTALAGDDYVLIGKTAHKIKPSIDTIAPDLSESVRNVEAIVENRNHESVAPLLSSLTATLDQLETDLA
jgi:HPt (histidine-containing phosphotransfer) domain-containing protein